MQYKMCSRCVMDNKSDDSIIFDKDSFCNYCTEALKRKDNVYYPGSVGIEKLKNLIGQIKEHGKNKKYDCLMGISGGLDSAYLAYLGAKDWGLRILGVHIDDGYDTEIAKSNITSLCKNCGIDLIEKNIDQTQFNNLIAAFFRAKVPGICNPQDNALFASLYKTSMEHKLNYFLSGTNFALESILQRGKGHPYSDAVNIKSIFFKNRRNKNQKINNIEFISLYDRYIKFKYIKKLKFLRLLDLIDYNKEKAIDKLQNVGFYYYGLKHNESILTRFVQNYYLPIKFGIDKRNSHYSSLVISNQLTREQAIIELNKPLYEDQQFLSDKRYILDRIGITDDEFDSIMKSDNHFHSEYKCSALIKLSGLARKYRRFLSD